QMHARASFTNGALRERAIATPIRIDLSVRFQARQPLPGVRPDRLQILQTTVPAIKCDIAWVKATCFGTLEHRAEVGVFGQAIDGFIKQPIIAGDGVLTITPQ